VKGTVEKEKKKGMRGGNDKGELKRG